METEGNHTLYSYQIVHVYNVWEPTFFSLSCNLLDVHYSMNKLIHQSLSLTIKLTGAGRKSFVRNQQKVKVYAVLMPPFLHTQTA